MTEVVAFHRRRRAQVLAQQAADDRHADWREVRAMILAAAQATERPAPSPQSCSA